MVIMLFRKKIMEIGVLNVKSDFKKKNNINLFINYI